LTRPRQAADWVTDLSGRHAIEAEVEATLRVHPTLTLLQTSTASYTRLDFQLLAPGDRVVELELKAKGQPLSEGWRCLRPDVPPSELFVLDELALRKLVDAGRYAFLLVRDVPGHRWCLWSAGDLLVASRVRHVRRLERGPAARAKGKLLFDLREAGHQAATLTGALDALCATTEDLERWWGDISPWPGRCS
jgi:hypothetical protein